MQVRFTRADYMRLPEGFPAQLVEGLLVKSPSATPGHQILASCIHASLIAIVGPYRAVQAPLDLVLDDLNVYQPDVLVWGKPQPWNASTAPTPVLVVEILSTLTRGRDRRVKTPRYLAAGVKEVWIVDPDERIVEVHSVNGVETARGEQQARSSVVPGLELVPDRLFA